MVVVVFALLIAVSFCFFVFFVLFEICKPQIWNFVRDRRFALWRGLSILAHPHLFFSPPWSPRPAGAGVKGFGGEGAATPSPQDKRCENIVFLRSLSCQSRCVASTQLFLFAPPLVATAAA